MDTNTAPEKTEALDLDPIRTYLDECETRRDVLGASRMARALRFLTWAAEARANAIGYRLEGRDEDAARNEARSSKYERRGIQYAAGQVS